jgi:hypothetical protein
LPCGGDTVDRQQSCELADRLSALSAALSSDPLATIK